MEVDGKNIQTTKVDRINIQDLSAFPSSHLKSRPEKELLPIEMNLVPYSHLFTELQIKLDHQPNFFHNIVCRIRRRNMKLLQRGTEASLRTLTEILLRGYGHTVWQSGSAWLVEESALPAEVGRLKYNKRPKAGENNRFYPILEQLWLYMRNIVFELRAVDNAPVRRKLSSQSMRSMFTEQTDADSYWTASQDCTVPDLSTGRPNLIPQCVRPPKAPKVSEETLTHNPIRFEEQCAGALARTDCSRDRIMTNAQTEDEILSILLRLRDVWRNSEPGVFEKLWEHHTDNMTLYPDILESMDNRGNDKDTANTLSVHMDETIGTLSTSGTSIRVQDNSSHCNDDSVQSSAFSNTNTDSNTITSTALSTSIPRKLTTNLSISIPQIVPRTIPVYISTGVIKDYPTNSYLPLSPVSSPWFWPDAPIAPDAMHAFLAGLHNRITVPAEHDVFAYILSYSWNHGMRMIENDLPGYFYADGRACEEKRRAGWKGFMLDLEKGIRDGGSNSVGGVGMRVNVFVLMGSVSEDVRDGEVFQVNAIED